MPLGKLSKRQIQAAYSILSEVQQVGGGPLGWLVLGERCRVTSCHVPGPEDLESLFNAAGVVSACSLAKVVPEPVKEPCF